MNEHDIPNESSEKNIDGFKSIVEQFEITPGSLAENLEMLDTHKTNLLNAVTKITVDNVQSIPELKPISEEIDTEVNAYMNLIEELPKHLLKEGFEEENIPSILAQQYVDLDVSTVEKLSKTLEDSDAFSYVSIENATNRIEINYQSSKQLEGSDQADGKSYMEIFGDLNATAFANNLQGDIDIYVKTLLDRIVTSKQQDTTGKIDYLVSSNEILIEAHEQRERANTPKAKLGRHALDILKIAGGSAIGFMIARKFSR